MTYKIIYAVIFSFFIYVDGLDKEIVFHLHLNENAAGVCTSDKQMYNLYHLETFPVLFKSTIFINGAICTSLVQGEEITKNHANDFITLDDRNFVIPNMTIPRNLIKAVNEKQLLVCKLRILQGMKINKQSLVIFQGETYTEAICKAQFEAYVPLWIQGLKESNLTVTLLDWGLLYDYSVDYNGTIDIMCTTNEEYNNNEVKLIEDLSMDHTVKTSSGSISFKQQLNASHNGKSINCSVDDDSVPRMYRKIVIKLHVYGDPATINSSETHNGHTEPLVTTIDGKDEAEVNFITEDHTVPSTVNIYSKDEAVVNSGDIYDDLTTPVYIIVDVIDEAALNYTNIYDSPNTPSRDNTEDNGNIWLIVVLGVFLGLGCAIILVKLYYMYRVSGFKLDKERTDIQALKFQSNLSLSGENIDNNVHEAVNEVISTRPVTNL